MKKFESVLLVLTLIVAASCSRPAAEEHEISLMDREIGLFPEAANFVFDIDVDYKQEKILAGCELKVRNPSEEPAEIIPLILYRLLDVFEVTDTDGAPIEFDQRVLKYEDFEQYQVNHIRIALDPALQPGDTRTVKLRYGGHLLGSAEAMRYVKDHISKEYTLLRTDSLVFPRIGINSWETNRKLGLGSFDYTLSITVPSPLMAASPGKLLSKKESGETVTYTYENLVSAWRLDAAVAQFDVLEDEQNKLKIFVLPEDRKAAERMMKAMKDARSFYQQWFGPLKVFKGLTVLEVPEGYGSQADKTAIIQQAQGFSEEGPLYEFYHELSHLWNVKSNDPMPPRFESEGMAMFMQHFMEEKLDGKKEAVVDAVNTSLSRLGTYFSEHPEDQNIPMIDYGNTQKTNLSYRMGQVLFYILYKKMGEEKFLEVVGSFYQDNFDSGATAQQFVDYFKEHSPVDLEKVFKEWVLTEEATSLLAEGISLTDLLARY